MPEVVGWGGGGGFMLVEWTMRDLTGSSDADFDLRKRQKFRSDVQKDSFEEETFSSTSARLAQSVEHETLNLRVVGSSPTLGELLFTSFCSSSASS